MQLKNKIFLTIGLGWLIFIGLTYLTLHYFFYSFIILNLLFLLFIFWSIHYFVLKRYATLDQHIHKLQLTNATLQQSITEHEVTERELIIHKERLVRLAHYDNLTALPNRVFFNEILNKAINHAKRHQKVLAILFINLDHFQEINNECGHHIGNLVLKELSFRFKGALRTGDILARLGGDEFFVLLNDVADPKFIVAVAEKLLKICKQIIKVDQHEVMITASIGVVIFPNDGESLEELQTHADMAMYKAKHAGGGNYQYYTQTMDIAAREHSKLETALRHALDHNEFILHYQPQLSLAKGTIKSVEALIRWQHPALGMLRPEKFIPFAEDTGLILAIGEWVLREACRQNKAWQREGYDPIIVTVNVSTKQFRHQDIAKAVEKALADSELDPAYLGIEITETAMIDNIDIAVDKLNSIHAMGVQIAIDDFGTGYTSINYLKQFPVNVLKIDQTFIKGIPCNPNDVAITSAIIALSHHLGLETVAEGVETIEQIQCLAEQKCDLIQGYFLSRPLPQNKIILQFTKRGKAKDKIME